MPVLKNPYSLKMASREEGSSGTLILDKDSRGTNPFEEDLDENERDSFLGDVSPESRNSSPEDGSKFHRDLFKSIPEGHYKRRATLEKLVGLSPFRMGKGRKSGGKDGAQNGEKGSDRRSLLGRMMLPLSEGNQGQRTPEKKKMRRSSEDFSLLQRFNGRRKEGLYNLDCGLAEKENGGGDTLKRMSFLKIGLGGKVRRASLVEKLSQTETLETAPVSEEAEPAKAKEPLSVLEILNLIHQRDLLTADRHIIELEAECRQAGQQSPESSEMRKDGSRKAKDVALLYEALLKVLWEVLAEALAAKSVSPALELMIRVIEQEEDTDRRWLAARGGTADGSGPRPRAMKQQWVEAVKQLVGQRLRQCLEGRAGPIAPLMDSLAKRALEDLCTVKFHLLHAYPKEYEAFSTYLCSYHQGLAQHLAEVVQRSLSISELYFVLDWNSNIYQREVLGRGEIAPLVSKAPGLGPLLSPETQRSLEEDCIAAVKAKTVEAMSRELQEEEERWAQEETEDSQFCLSSKIISVLRAHTDRAPQITADFGMRMAQCCLSCLAEFLQSFQRKVEKFHEGQAESSRTVDSYTSRTVALVNYCPPFQDYVKCLVRFGHPESKKVECQARDALDGVTRLCNRMLADQIFLNLKPCFHRLMKRKWLSSSEAFSTMMALLSEHAQKMKKMKPEPYQMLVRDVHHGVLIEYIRPLMRVRTICTSSKMRSKMAAKLRSEAQQLQEFFAQLKSTSAWLDSAVPHLAEIIELEDMPAIQMEVGFLANDFPDVQKKHVSAILDVRGLRNQVQRQDILAVLEGLEQTGEEASPCQEQAFFTKIPTSEVSCLRVKLHRLSHVGHACLSRLRWRPRQLQRRQRQRPKDNEAESQV
ncbi:exocyst complex component 3-like protein 2 [Eublepharis macularius]|uniref:Exocyst complex component 3-like protein 2 n=1 Tax=Eublepharis macularius TaxID=481883 RepID=A0AA97KGV5_EUBMA|nr:exocyst complex component 3-like protein 2 [Eublepharis macularius]XP_054855811.1 exocyst complex component 3-like protein 2 [Eublepharis macularius]XP_054855812.1 exocyst complex component 3-like protein 2 [Eublepharis macularius]XP_054855813.1 exocyst complex component 3-like protein 2 [Eublepharis macularius]